MPKYAKLDDRRPLPATRIPPPAEFAAFVAHAGTFSPWMKFILQLKLARKRLWKTQ